MRKLTETIIELNEKVMAGERLPKAMILYAMDLR